MTAKEYFQKIGLLNSMIRAKLMYINTLRDTLSISAPPTDNELISHTRNVHALADRVAMVMDAEKEADEMIDEMVDLRRRVVAAINQMDDLSQATFITARYLEGKTTKEIAQEHHYSVRWIEQRISDGMDKLTEILGA